MDLPTAIQTYQADSNVVFAEPNYVFKAHVVPNDPYYASKGSWGQKKSGGQPLDDMWGVRRIGAQQVWSTQGGKVRVGVLDSGLDYTHPDLAANVAINAREDRNGNGRVDGEPIDCTKTPIAPNGDFNCVDDDGNGDVDDLRGWDATTCTEVVDDEICRTGKSKSPDNDPMDDHGHGTFVAGIIGAVANNGIGIAGVAYNHAEILPVKVLNAVGSGLSADIAEGIRYAADNGAKVLNLSFGINDARPRLVEEAVAYAVSKGCVVVASAGNDAIDVAFVSPASFPNAIAVAATDSGDLPAPFSNSGDRIDVAAPGVDILSLRAKGTDMSFDPRRDQTISPHVVGGVNGQYYWSDGTSFAAPIVAGLAALYWARNPQASASTIRDRVRFTTKALLRDPEGLFGTGLANANQMFTSPLSPGPYLQPKGIRLADAPPGGNGDGIPQIGEEVTAVMGIGNRRDDARSVLTTVASSDRVIEAILKRAAGFGDIPRDQKRSNTQEPFRLRLGTFLPDTPAVLNVTAQSSGTSRMLRVPIQLGIGKIVTGAIIGSAITGRPDIEGTRVVYAAAVAENDRLNLDVYLHDIATHQTTRLTTDPLPQVRPAIAYPWMVWEDHPADVETSEIFLHDLRSGQTRRLTQNESMDDSPQVSGDWVAWTRSDGVDTTRIYVHQISTDQTRPLMNRVVSTGTLALDGPTATIVWSDFIHGAPEIYAADLRTGQERRLTNDDKAQFYPAIDGDTAVWMDVQSGTSQIVARNLTTDVQWQVSSAIPGQAVSAGIMPAIDDHRVVWASYANGHWGYLRGKDLRTGEEFQLTHDDQRMYYTPDISGNRVIWIEYGRLDGVYMAQWPEPDLRIVRFSSTPPSGSSSQGSFTVTYENRGPVDVASHDLSLLINGQPAASVTIPSLVKNSQAVRTFQVTWPTTPGTYEAKVILDVGNRIAESDEGNNESTISFTVVAPAAAVRGKVAKQDATAPGSVGPGLDGVQVRLRGGTTDRTTTTTADGSFEFIGVANGTYTLTVTSPLYIFSGTQGSLAVNVKGQDVAVSTRLGQVRTIQISGTIRSEGQGIRAVGVGLFKPSDLQPIRQVTTSSTGFYSFTAVPVSSTPYTVKPSTRNDMTFSPAERTIAALTATNVSGIDFEAEKIAQTDVAVTQLRIEPAGGGAAVTTAKVGDELRFAVDIANLGSADAPANVLAAYVDSQEIGRMTLASLPRAARQTHVIPVTWTATAGTHQIKAIIDADRQLSEPNETNNERAVALIVTDVPVEAYFKFHIPSRADTFIVRLTDPATIQAAREILSGRRTTAVHVMGTIIKTPASYNPDWSYHLDPSTIEFFEVAAEVCDAGIQYVEEHLNEVGGALLPGNRWCPWGSGLLREVTPAANRRPIASITMPANGTTVSAPATLTLQATASDPDGTITKIEFYNGTTKLGKDETAPYTFTWSDVAVGTYTLTAKATDNQNATTTSAPVTLTVSAPPTNRPPQLSPITHDAVDQDPAREGLQVAFGTVVTYRSSVSDLDNEPVTWQWLYTVDGGAETERSRGTQLPTLLASNVFTYPNIPKTYVWIVRASDGKATVEQRLRVEVVAPPPANQPPTVTLTTQPATGPFTAPATITLQATASDPDGLGITLVEFFQVDPDPTKPPKRLGGDTTAPYTTTWRDVPAGTYTLRAVATDKGGATTEASVTVTVGQTPSPNQPPTIQWLRPTRGATFTAPATIELAVDAKDPDGPAVVVVFSANDLVLGVDIAAPYTFTWTDVPTGTYRLQAKVVDSQQTTTPSEIISIEVNAPVINQPPSVSDLGAFHPSARGQALRAELPIEFHTSARDPENQALTYAWDFGDGSPAGTTNPIAHTYAAAGTYTVSLTVSDGTLTTTKTKPVTIRAPVINQPPSVSDLGAFHPSAPGQRLTSGLPLQLHVSARDPENQALTYAWDFGDGTTPGTTNPILHTYAQPGDYPVSLSVSDGTLTTTVTKTLTLRAPPVNQPPEVSAIGTFHPSAPGQRLTSGLPLQLHVSARDPETQPLTYAWDFGDGTTPGTTNPILHTYAQPGDYPVSLSVSDGTLTTTVTKSVTLQTPNTPPTINSIINQVTRAILPSMPNPGPTVRSTIQANDPDGDPLTYRWDFGGEGSLSPESISQGATQQGTVVELRGANTVRYHYTSPGVYQITVSVSDGRATATKQVSVNVPMPVTQKPPRLFKPLRST